MRAWPLLLVAAVAHAETRAQYGGDATAALASAPTTLDPLRGGPGDAELQALVFDTPFVIADGKPRPSLALALDNPPGGRRARLIVRNDVKFSDGTPLTARDVLASLHRALRKSWTLAPIASLTPAGDQAIDIELSRPTPELALLLASPAAMVTPGGAAPNGHAVGSGPFVVESSDAATVRLVANSSHFAGRPYLHALTMRAYPARGDESGAYEVGALQAARHAPPADVPQRRPAVAVEGPQTMVGFVAVGKIANADAIRRALALAINRERLRRLTVREPASAIKATYDPARAKSEIDRIGGARLSLLVDGSRLDDGDVAGRILADLARVGIALTIEAVDAAQYQARLQSGRYELYLGAVAAAPEWEPIALVAAVDAEAASAAMAKGGAVDLEKSRVVPLYRRTTRLFVAPELRDLAVDGLGRAGWADAHWLSP